MKISRLRSQWISFTLVCFTAHTCIKAVFRSLLGTINRVWVDKTLHLWIDRLLKAVHVSYEVKNPHDITLKKGTPYIIMCNHTSAYDIPLGFKVFPNNSIRMLAKRELSKIPVLNKAMVASEFPFIDRKNRKQAIKDLAYARKLMLSGIVLWVAPEGTRSLDGKLTDFKKGGFIAAIQSKATIIPIGIRGAYEILPAKTKNFNLNQHAEIHVGKAFDASSYKMDNKEQLIKLVHDEMKKLVGK
jgi:1-acyl-sn-glycerol-3-phosphate acyltransferase